MRDPGWKKRFEIATGECPGPDPVVRERIVPILLAKVRAPVPSRGDLGPLSREERELRSRLCVERFLWAKLQDCGD